MASNRHMDKICCAGLIASLLLTVLFMNGEALGIQPPARVLGYESRLFDTTRVHTIEIAIDGWPAFLDTCEDEEYTSCSVVIDGEAYKNVGLRAKGNTSLSSVSQMGSDRYSFKIEFDQYDSGKTYYGLDKLCLNNLIQDNTFMKDYLTYQMMDAFGVDSPLCSYVYITVNGEDWGLYLAVEGVEEGFLQRNYGTGYGQLYKPDSMGFGGGRGNGMAFDMDDFLPREGGRQARSEGDSPQASPNGPGQPPDGQDNSPGNMGRGVSPSAMPGSGNPGGTGSSDVKLQYIDDDPDSYANIFDNAKTEASQADQQRLIASLKSLASYEDLDEVLETGKVLRYFVVHNFVVNGDSYTGDMIHNYYLYEQDGRLSMIPWDYNLAFGGFQSANAGGAVNDPIDEALADRPMQAWIFSDQAYTATYHALFAEFLDAIDIEGIIDNAYALIAPYVEKDPTKFCEYEEFETGVRTLKAFCALRAESVRGQLGGSVPSTEAAQREDASALIDASQIDLSDMGSMGSTGNSSAAGTVRETFGAEPPAGGESPAFDRQPGPTAAGGQGAPGFGGGFPPPGTQGAGNDRALQMLILLGASVLVLLLGIIFAKNPGILGGGGRKH